MKKLKENTKLIVSKLIFLKNKDKNLLNENMVAIEIRKMKNTEFRKIVSKE